jgi:predicted kinase
MWDVASRVLVLGVDVVLDFGCWARSERDAFRARVASLGADFRMYFAEASADVLFTRLRVRNEVRPEGTFFIPEAKLKKWIEIFEPPSAEELASSTH